MYVFESCLVQSDSQALQREIVVTAVLGAAEVNRPSDDERRAEIAELFFGGLSELAEDDTDQIFKTFGPPVAAASIAQHGGRYLARGGKIEVLEGDWTPRIIVVVEFPDMERARAWYRSPEYALALEVRDKALSRNLILVEGVAPPSLA